MIPTEETVSLFKRSVLQIVQRMKRMGLPYSDEVHSHTPGERVLKLSCNLPCLWLSRTNGFVVIVSPAKGFVRIVQVT